MTNEAVIANCDQMEDGDQVWFPSRFEAEQVCDSGCCELIPAPADYDGPRYFESTPLGASHDQ